MPSVHSYDFNAKSQELNLSLPDCNFVPLCLITRKGKSTSDFSWFQKQSERVRILKICPIKWEACQVKYSICWSKHCRKHLWEESHWECFRLWPALPLAHWACLALTCHKYWCNGLKASGPRVRLHVLRAILEEMPWMVEIFTNSQGDHIWSSHWKAKQNNKTKQHKTRTTHFMSLKLLHYGNQSGITLMAGSKSTVQLSIGKRGLYEGILMLS